MLGMYGILPFACSSSAVQTFRDVQISHSARWATHEVIGETPVNEYIGPDRQKISFKVQILSAMNGSPALTDMALDRMLKSGKSGRCAWGLSTSAALSWSVSMKTAGTSLVQALQFRWTLI